MSIKTAALRTFSPILRTFPNFAGIITPPLKIVVIEPTNACNLHCRMCVSKGRATGYMDMELFRRIIRHDLEEFPDTAVHLNFGGESFLHPQFGAMMQECISTKRRVSGLITNGMLIEPHVETIAKALSTITISLDGVGKVNDEIRLGCNYEKVIQNIRKLKAARERLRTGIRIEVQCTKTTQTDAELEEFLSEMKDLADTVKIGIAKDANNRFVKSQPRVAPFCYSPFGNLIVLWNGEVSYCDCAIAFPPVIGNAYEKSLREIWFGSMMRRTRVEAVKYGVPQSDACKICGSWACERIVKTWNKKGEKSPPLSK